jgi:hypothetical protein
MKTLNTPTSLLNQRPTPLREQGRNKHNNTNNGEVNQDINAATIPRNTVPFSAHSSYDHKLHAY